MSRSSPGGFQPWSPPRGLANDGEFGPKTQQAVKCFQKQQGPCPDGVIGPPPPLLGDDEARKEAQKIWSELRLSLQACLPGTIIGRSSALVSCWCPPGYRRPTPAQVQLFRKTFGLLEDPSQFFVRLPRPQCPPPAPQIVGAGWWRFSRTPVGRITVLDPSENDAWGPEAEPIVYRRTGIRSFYIDETGILLGNDLSGSTRSGMPEI
jgi:peptidoglycan hydrolase-like protein with peptidoglycan-binding domain